MEKTEAALTEVLRFREEKAMIQDRMLQRGAGKIAVGIGMNIPGPVKSGPSVYHAFLEERQELERILSKKHATVCDRRVLERNAGYASVYLVSGIKAEELKRETVLLEETHPAGRVFDIDILTPEGTAVPREAVGAGKRKCLICGRDAKVCGRSRSHTVEELQKKTFGLLAKWEAERIGTTAWRALLEEVYTTPKPGLVDRYSCGAHRDMDLKTFERSAEALHPYFIRMAAQGYGWDREPEELFAKIRGTGLEAEQAMYRATGGVNTHKGLIFTLGILCAAAGACAAKSGRITVEAVIGMEQQMTAGILSRELDRISSGQAVSHGEQNLKKYGTEGIRGEAVRGYPSVVKTALPVLRQGRRERRDWNLVKLQTLLTLMTRTEDSNILARRGPEELRRVQEEAMKFLSEGGAYAENACGELKEMDADYIRRGVSPGGCADLLAAAVFLELLIEE